jgi:hypothetical protein
MKYLYGILLTSAVVVSSQTLAADQRVTKPSAESIQIYGAFLDQFLGQNGSANLGQATTPLSADNLRDYSECLRGVRFLPPSDNGPKWFAAGELSRRKRIHFIDANQWQARDPHDAIQHGKKIADAVSDGFKAGLLELSTIAFDEQHRTALLVYSFSCGSLCGNGGPAFYERTRSGWKRREVPCGSWIS